MKNYNYFPRPNTIIIEVSAAWADHYEHLELPRGNLHAILKNSVRYEVSEDEFSEWLSCADFHRTHGQKDYGWNDNSQSGLAIGSAARGFLRQMQKKGFAVGDDIEEGLFPKNFTYI